MAFAGALAFYVSGHGFGHASREVEVLNRLGSCRPDLQLVLCTAVNAGLLDRTLRVPVTRRPGACDTGVIQRDSITHDDEATVREAWEFHRTLATRADAEASALAPFNVRAVVGDIAPLAFEVAARLGVPSIAIGNFTWNWIYEWYPELLANAPGLIDTLQRAYRRATLALELPLAGGFDVFPAVERIPFIARHATHSREATRARLGLGPRQKVALLSFGGYGLPSLRLDQLDCAPEWTVILTDRTATSKERARPTVVSLPESTFDRAWRYEDLVAAVDVVVTKPGYGIASECAASGTAMLYTSRGAFREYDLLVREMPSHLRCRFISQEDLFEGRWRQTLDALFTSSPPPTRPPTNGAEVAARRILEVGTL